MGENNRIVIYLEATISSLSAHLRETWKTHVPTVWRFTKAGRWMGLPTACLNCGLTLPKPADRLSIQLVKLASGTADTPWQVPSQMWYSDSNGHQLAMNWWGKHASSLKVKGRDPWFAPAQLDVKLHRHGDDADPPKSGLRSWPI